MSAGRKAIGGWTALGVALVLFTHAALLSARTGFSYDLAPLVAAGRLAADGRLDHLYAHDPRYYNYVNDPFFDRAAAESGFARQSTPFVYPPLVAVAMQPLASLSMRTVALVWSVLSVGFVLVFLELTLRTYLPGRGSLWLRAGVLVALIAFEPLRYGFWLGQTTALIIALVIGALFLERRGRPALAGALLAAAAFVKIAPLLVATAWLIRKPRTAAFWCGVWLAALWLASLLVCGVALNTAYLARVRQISHVVVIAFNNHSLVAVLSRIGTSPAAWRDWTMYLIPIWATVVSAAILAVFVLASGLMLRRLRSDADRSRAVAEASSLLLAILAPGIAWTHYFVLLIPVAAAVMCLDSPPRGPSLLAVLALTLCCHTWVPQPSPHVAAFWAGAPALAALVLWAALLWAASDAGPASDGMDLRTWRPVSRGRASVARAPADYRRPSPESARSSRAPATKSSS